MMILFFLIGILIQAPKLYWIIWAVVLFFRILEDKT